LLGNRGETQLEVVNGQLYYGLVFSLQKALLESEIDTLLTSKTDTLLTSKTDALLTSKIDALLTSDIDSLLTSEVPSLLPTLGNQFVGYGLHDCLPLWWQGALQHVDDLLMLFSGYGTDNILKHGLDKDKPVGITCP